MGDTDENATLETPFLSLQLTLSAVMENQEPLTTDQARMDQHRRVAQYLKQLPETELRQVLNEATALTENHPEPLSLFRVFRPAYSRTLGHRERR